MTIQTIVHVISHLVIHLVYFVAIVKTAPPDYCLKPLNKSDCNMKPTAVFSYYLSGSRCEIEYWRGCPTYNKFDSEFDCSNMCIFHFNRPPVKEHVKEPSSKKIKPLLTETNKLLFEELMQMPEGNLAIIDDIVNELNEEIVKVKLHLPKEMETESSVINKASTTTTAITSAANDAAAVTTTEASAETTTKKTDEEETTTQNTTEATLESTTGPTPEPTTEAPTEAPTEASTEPTPEPTTDAPTEPTTEGTTETTTETADDDDEATAENPENSDESGLPEEVETP